jgi:signal transduction histidine kinase
MLVLVLTAMLGLVYFQTAGYLGRQADQVVNAEAADLKGVTAEALPGRVERELRLDPRHIALYGLFSRDGVWITGNVRRLPDIPADGTPRDLGAKAGFADGARVLVARLPWGEALVVGRETAQLAEFRAILVSALFWSGGLMIVVGLALGAALSIHPLRRIQGVRDATARVAQGDLGVRLPVAGRHDELDMLAGVVNAMMDEIERLVAEAKSVGDVLAHDLRTPVTRLRLLLSRLRQSPELTPSHVELLDQAQAETDTLLGRFRAILRITEIENQNRRAGFRQVDLAAIVDQAEELYGPLAEESGLTLTKRVAGPALIQGDPDLLFEALGNLIDNAVKFTPRGGAVVLLLAKGVEGPELAVIDNGSGIAPEERQAVVQRFYRSQKDQARPGAGLGLSIVAAITHLHGFALVLEDAGPGLGAFIQCWPRALQPSARP